MFRLVCTSPFFWFSAQGASSRYIIKKGAYLVEAPPKRPTSSYALFLKDELTGKKNLDVATAAVEVSKKWKLYPQIQQKYTKLAAERNAGYSLKKEEYEKKYVVPFKRITSNNIRIQQLFKDKKITVAKGETIKNVGKKVKEALSEVRTLEGDQKLKAEANKIKEERNNLKKVFQFPPLLYTSLRSYKMRHSLPEVQRGPTYEEDLQKAYNAEVEKWKENVKQWLAANKYDLNLDEFLKLHQKDLKERKAKKSEYEDEDDE